MGAKTDHIERHIRQALEIRRLIHLVRDTLRECKMPLHHGAIPIAPVRAQRRPHRKRASAARHLDGKVAVDRSRQRLRSEIGGGGRKAAGVDCRIPHKCKASVIGSVEPLVSIDRDRVSAVDPVGEVTGMR